MTLTGAALLAACGGHTLTGTMTLPLSGAYTVGTECTGTGGYDDVFAGTPVIVSDESGKVLATGKLEAGKKTASSCEFPFQVSSIPDASFYKVEVSHRGQLTYSRDDMDKASWHVAMSLG